jgi:hypothetical protein
MGTEVVKDSRFLLWNRITLQRLTTRYPRLLQNVLSIAEVYLDWYLTAHIALSCDSARTRCASVLTNIGHAVGREVAGIELAITNEELASAAAITVYDASRFISDWQRSGALAKTPWKDSCAFAGLALSGSSRIETNQQTRTTPPPSMFRCRSCVFAATAVLAYTNILVADTKSGLFRIGSSVHTPGSEVRGTQQRPFQ